MKSRLLLDVVISKSASIFELLSSEDETLLIWRNSFLVLDLLLYSVDGIRRVNIKSNGLSSQSLNEDLHGSSTKTKYKVKGRLFLNVVVGKSATIF
mmetsp:Transcript_67849/g.180568  ORF Transcript_67849/g.180568 Transcript_67849/m.180568 type:complete len:96 (+) Transcript_67849:133-420(+)